MWLMKWMVWERLSVLICVFNVVVFLLFLLSVSVIFLLFLCRWDIVLIRRFVFLMCLNLLI